ncbi:MAG: S-layer homology domain-containing protein [Oscillospiraceae bacterium]|nr:S-layer homology domain-containing protein [Oscillospiraceae bacterium]
MRKVLSMVLAIAMVMSLASVAFAASFTDVEEGQFYNQPINWAVENKITNGLSATEFGINVDCSRAQVVTFLYRVAGSPEVTGENPFEDVLEGEYYTNAVLWAVSEGITNGLSTTEFGVNVACSRAQVVTFLWRAAGSPAPASSENPFDDVLEDQYYTEAILWAVEKGITKGLSETEFGVNVACNRAQVVTFLYRYVRSEIIYITNVEEAFKTDVNNGETRTYGGKFTGMTLTIEDAQGVTVTYKNKEYTADESGVLTVEFATSGMGVHEFTITNNSGENADYSLNFEYPMGTFMNPEPLMNIEQINYSVEAGNESGYYYSYYPMTNGTLVITAEDYDETKFDVIVTTSANYTQYTMSEGEGTVSLDVAYGDEIIIQVVAVADEETWQIPAIEGTLTGEIVLPEGTMGNPAELVMGENVASVAANSWEGYWYNWTAAEKGELILTFSAEPGWFYTVNNKTTGAYGDGQWNDSDPVVNPAVIAVNEGDVLEINVNTYDPADMWNTPAGDVIVTAEFVSTATEGTVYLNSAYGSGESKVVKYTAEEDGILTLTMGAVQPGWAFKVTDADGITSIRNSGNTEKSFTYELKAGDVYYFEFWAYNKAAYEETNGQISYALTFEPAEIEDKPVEPEEYIVSETALALGDNALTLDENATTTIYVFEPAEVGTYSFTAPEGAIVGYWGAGSWFLTDPASTTNTCEWTCTGVGQSAYIGVSSVEGEFNLTVVKTAEGGGEQQIEYVNYVNTHTFPEGFDFITAENTVTAVDITTAHTAVLGSDGYYHLDSANGEILYIDLETEGWSLTQVVTGGESGMSAITLRGGVEVNGETKYYDFLSAMRGYYNYVDSDGMYPLTEDLMLFVKGYGAYQGWFMPGLSPFASMTDAVDADTAWMVICYSVDGVVSGEGEEEENIPVALTLGDNSYETVAGDADGSLYTFTAAEAGTVNIKITSLSQKNSGTGEWTDFAESMLPYLFDSRNNIVTINGIALNYTNTASVEVAAGDVITISIINANGNAIKGNMNLSYAEESGGEIIETPEGAFILAQDSGIYLADANACEIVEVTATQAGTLTITIDANPGFELICGEDQFSTSSVMQQLGSGSYSVEVEAGDPYCYIIYGFDGGYSGAESIDYVVTLTPAE